MRNTCSCGIGRLRHYVWTAVESCTLDPSCVGLDNSSVRAGYTLDQLHQSGELLVWRAPRLSEADLFATSRAIHENNALTSACIRSLDLGVSGSIEHYKNTCLCCAAWHAVGIRPGCAGADGELPRPPKSVRHRSLHQYAAARMPATNLII